MSRPPSIIDLTLGRHGGKPRHLWLPVFLLWPVLAAVGLLAFALALLVDAVWRASGQPGGHWTAMLLSGLATLAEARGLEVRVKGPSTTIDLTVR